VSRPDAERPEWVGRLTAAAAAHGVGEMARLNRAHDGSGRLSAVLIALGQFDPDPDAGPGVLLLQRSTAMRNHPGQVAFPGGATDPEDAGPSATALREATEEVGLDPASVEVLAELPSLYLPSGFLITPVLGWWHSPHEVGVVDEGEVARVEVVPIAELVDPANRFTVRLPRGGPGVGFAARGLFIWGFTAGLLDQLLRLGGWSRDWDASVVRDVPGSAWRPAAPHADVSAGHSADVSAVRQSGEGTVAS
jgi:8-oxo-dGTP pyrophosphatase MutT (NUDIX family)